jgi:hypothetical protein
MVSRKFVRLVTVFVIISTFFVPSPSVMMEMDDGNMLEIPDEAHSYCGMDLVRAIRKYCRVKVIEKYKLKDPPRNFHKPSRCGENIKDKCCYRSNKCNITTFIQYCPYRFVRK